jgi:hypothetical protein
MAGSFAIRGSLATFAFITSCAGAVTPPTSGAVRVDGSCAVSWNPSSGAPDYAAFDLVENEESSVTATIEGGKLARVVVEKRDFSPESARITVDQRTLGSPDPLRGEATPRVQLVVGAWVRVPVALAPYAEAKYGPVDPDAPKSHSEGRTVVVELRVLGAKAEARLEGGAAATGPCLWGRQVD